MRTASCTGSFRVWPNSDRRKPSKGETQQKWTGVPASFVRAKPETLPELSRSADRMAYATVCASSSYSIAVLASRRIESGSKLKALYESSGLVHSKKETTRAPL